ncbi:MAG TPA: aspartate ammonia-lyase [bacterium]|nr:aspartate ammonia-lyase [bacterium]
MMKTRLEKDSLGAKAVPQKAYYGVETVRAIENFPISGLRFHPSFIRALAVIKKSCARANLSLRKLDSRRAKAIIRACDEIIRGKWHDQFVTDALQSGAGVSAHMNANEVIANRALEILGKKRGNYGYLHSHDHVNMGQSTNDVIPTAIRLGALYLLNDFYRASAELEKAFLRKAVQFRKVVKTGRTHLQDAAPITLGQEMSGWARQIEKARVRVKRLAENLLELGIGGSAVGTGLNTTLRYRRKVIAFLRQESKMPVRSAKNLFEVMQSDVDMAALSGGLRDYALCLVQISNDLRLLSSGPQTGLAEIRLPARQPGSSIMPGKINPVMPEVTAQTAFQVIGNDLSVAFAASSGQLELNVMRTVIAYNLLQSIELLKNVAHALGKHCITGIEADEDRCFEYAERSFGIAAALNPYIGYSKAAECVKEACRKGKTLREVVLEKELLTPAQLNRILSPENLTKPKN